MRGCPASCPGPPAPRAHSLWALPPPPLLGPPPLGGAAPLPLGQDVQPGFLAAVAALRWSKVLRLVAGYSFCFRSPSVRNPIWESKVCFVFKYHINLNGNLCGKVK